MDPFERSGRTGVALGILLVLIAAAHIHSSPTQSRPLPSNGLPTAVTAASESNPDSTVKVDVVHDEKRFIAWTTDTRLQTCLNVAVLTGNAEASSLRDAAPKDVISDRVCGPLGTLPTDNLTLYKTVSDPASHYGVVVVVLPDHFADSEWSITVDNEPTRTSKEAQTVAFEYDEPHWPADSRIDVTVKCECGSYQQTVDLLPPGQTSREAHR